MKGEKLETAILAKLRQYRGSIDNSLAAWGNSLQAMLGERPNEVDLVAALKRLRNTELVRLIKYTGYQADSYDYTKYEHVDEDWFFYTGTFTVAITDEGRGWDVSKGTSMGFQKPA
jgi:uncharacterized protein